MSSDYITIWLYEYLFYKRVKYVLVCLIIFRVHRARCYCWVKNSKYGFKTLFIQGALFKVTRQCDFFRKMAVQCLLGVLRMTLKVSSPRVSWRIERVAPHSQDSELEADEQAWSQRFSSLFLNGCHALPLQRSAGIRNWRQWLQHIDRIISGDKKLCRMCLKSYMMNERTLCVLSLRHLLGTLFLKCKNESQYVDL